MGDKGSSAASTTSVSKNSKGRVQVPYGSPYSKEQQAKNVQDKVKSGLQELMGLVKDGTSACVDRAAVVEHATKLDRQAEKIQEAIVKDTVFIEEVRHHHNRISDLCDNTRAYTHEQMVADLKRAAAIRVNVMTIVQGKPPEFELEQEELDELKSVRLMLRRKYGAKTRDKQTDEFDMGPVDQSAMNGTASNVKANMNRVQAGLMGQEMDTATDDVLRANAPTPGTWANDVLGSK
jgi:hypothetical protein